MSSIHDSVAPIQAYLKKSLNTIMAGFICLFVLMLSLSSVASYFYGSISIAIISTVMILPICIVGPFIVYNIYKSIAHSQPMPTGFNVVMSRVSKRHTAPFEALLDQDYIMYGTVTAGTAIAISNHIKAVDRREAANSGLDITQQYHGNC